MLFRNCAGGIVFCGDRVLLLKNEKDEWVMPKGVVREGVSLMEVAVLRARAEAGVDARILESAGETCYEFYSITRGKPVCNRIQWFIMEAAGDACQPSEPFTQAGFFPHDDALTRVTYTQDRSLLAVAWDKYEKMHQKL